MRKLFFACLCLILSLGFAVEILPNSPIKASAPGSAQSRIAPSYTFSVAPTSLMTNYYDYMIGSYNSLPLRLIPTSAGGGYFMTFHGKRTPSGTRRVFFAYVDANGNVVNSNEITSTNNFEGYPGMAVDPVSGKPMYAWHMNSDTDVEYEVRFVSDAFIYGIAGLFNEIQTVIDNPSVVQTNTGSTYDNEFIWPSVQVGPSPIANKRRVYVLARNSVSHSYGPSENVKIAYADFDGDMLESSQPLVWSYTSIPEMDQWNVDTTWRRPFHAFSVDNLGNIYYSGYHFTEDLNGTYLDEEDFCVFKCDNYGAGTWTRISDYSHIPICNPPQTPGGSGYFSGSNGSAIPDSDLHWAIQNSSHLNAVVDNAGRIHVSGLWTVSTTQGSAFSDFYTVKSMIFDPATNSFSISEIYPRKDPSDDFNDAYTPWDTQAPWGEPEYVDPGDGSLVLDHKLIFPFPHWNEELHTDAMMFHYNNIKLSEVNDQGMMVAVWQDSYRAKCANEYVNNDYNQYDDSPEIFIAVSVDQGNSWSEPIILNNVDTPAFDGIKPMWVYPADKVKYVGMQGENRIGRIGLMFYNDYTWGANAISPPAHPTNDGGAVMFAELEIVFPVSNYQPIDPFGVPLVLSSSMTLMAGVEINDQAASDGDVLAAYVEVNGVPQLRGKETLQINTGVAGCLMQIYTESDDEEVFFKVFRAQNGIVYDVVETLTTIVNGTVGAWPDSLFWLHAYQAQEQTLSLNTGWNLFSLNVHPTNADVSAVFGDIMDNVQSIKSPEGIFEPGNPYSTLTALTDGSGYCINMNSPTELEVLGIPISYDTPLALAEGWNLVGYYPASLIPVEAAVASISNNLIQVKGTEGVYEPGNPYSTLNFLSPGKAYWMKLYSAAELIYPSISRHEAPVFAGNENLQNPVFKSNSQSVLLSFGEGAAAGDQVMAFVGDELRGSATLRQIDGQLGALVQIFTDQSDEAVAFKLVKADGNTLAMQPGLSTEPGSIVGDYQAGIFFALQTGDPETPELNTALGRAYPNPFNHGTNITLTVGSSKDLVKVAIYNVRGQIVRTLLQGKAPTGAINLAWDGCDDSGHKMPSGVYFCRLQDGKTNQSRKLLLLK